MTTTMATADSYYPEIDELINGRIYAFDGVLYRCVYEDGYAYVQLAEFDCDPNEEPLVEPSDLDGWKNPVLQSSSTPAVSSARRKNG